MRKPTPLKRAFFESGVAQKDVAAEIGMDPTQLSKIVNGLHASEATRRKLAKALGRPVEDLFPPDSSRDEVAA